MIHSTAIIHEDAKLGDGVSIGPYTVIGAEVSIGEGTSIGPHVVINGPTRIGQNNRIYQFSSLGDAPQSISYQGEATRLEIGDNNTIREYCTINRGTVEGGGITRVGSDNWIMAYAHVAHDCAVGNHCIFANGTSLAGHVEVGDYVIFGGFTMVHQFCRVGEHSFTAINTVTFKDIPPYMLVAGNTAEPHGIHLKGLKRRNFSEQTRQELRNAYKRLFRGKKPLSVALEELQAEPHGAEVERMIGFIKASKRGIVL